MGTTTSCHTYIQKHNTGRVRNGTICNMLYQLYLGRCKYPCWEDFMLNFCRLVKIASNGVRPQIVIMSTDEVGEIGIANSKRLLFLDK